MASADITRIRSIHPFFGSYPIESVVGVHRFVTNPTTIDYIVIVKVRKLFGGFRIKEVEVSDRTFIAANAHVESADLVDMY